MKLLAESNTHEFAFYTQETKNIANQRNNLEIQILTDPVLTHRILNILRLEKGEKIILFDSQFHIKCKIFDVKNKNIALEINEIKQNIQQYPHITWVLPILKREAFEESIYILTAIGIQDIQLILTSKTHKTYNNDSERIRKIMIAAAEQSKQFIIPNLLPIVPFDLWILSNNSTNNSVKIFLDPSGISLQDTIDKIRLSNTQKLTILNGPEGDLTLHEKELLKDHGFIFCKLTNTILKAEHAVTIASGVFRALL